MAQAMIEGLGQPNLKLEVASGDVLDVRRFVVREGVQTLFEVEVEAVDNVAEKHPAE